MWATQLTEILWFQVQSTSVNDAPSYGLSSFTPTKKTVQQINLDHHLEGVRLLAKENTSEHFFKNKTRSRQIASQEEFLHW